jgi:hypothetical protein
MTKFKLKIKSTGNIEVFKDNEEYIEGEDFKEILAYIAKEIIDENIDDYEITLCERGSTEKLKNFDPVAILKNSKKIKIEEDDDDSDDNESTNKSRGRNTKEVVSRPRFIYTPRNNSATYTGIGLSFGDAFSKIGNKND